MSPGYMRAARRAREKAMRDIDHGIEKYKRDSDAVIEQTRMLESNWHQLARALVAIDLALGVGDVEAARRMIDDIQDSAAFPRKDQS